MNDQKLYPEPQQDPSPAWKSFSEQNRLISQWWSQVRDNASSIESFNLRPRDNSFSRAQHAADIASANFLYFDFKSADVQSGNFAPTTTALMDMSDNRQLCLDHKGRYVFRFIDAPDSNQSLNQCLSERVRFLQDINGFWSYWLHFMAPVPENKATLMLLLYKKSTASTSDFLRPSAAKMHQALCELQQNTAVLHASMNISPSETRKTCARIGAVLSQLHTH